MRNPCKTLLTVIAPTYLPPQAAVETPASPAYSALANLVQTSAQAPAQAPAQAQAWAPLWAQVAQHMQALGAHPARTVVLLPFFQLQAVARASSRAYSRACSTADGSLGNAPGFMPRLETTKSWSQRLGHFMPSAVDISFDAGQDSLRAAAWLQRAGLGPQRAMLTASLVQTAHQLGALVAAVAPAQRPAWAEQARAQALQAVETLASNPLKYEAAVARIALEWAAASRYASDVLFDAALHSSLDALVVVPGLQANPLASALAQHWQAVSCTASWGEAAQEVSGHQVSQHPCTSAHDEADRASACVLQHIAAGRVPVALAAVDRVTTRRISATLGLHGVALQDETGWKLSTTRAAASVMALLRAARWRGAENSRTDNNNNSHSHSHNHSQDGAQDALLDWLKHTNAPSALVEALERAFREPNTALAQGNAAQAAIEFIVGSAQQVQPNMTASALLATLRASRSVGDWLTSLQQALRTSGQWGALIADPAGRDCLQALHVLQPENVAEAGQSVSQNMGLAEFTAWASDCLENASFKPSADANAMAGSPTAQVVVLPLAQVLARPFEAIVIAGADEQRLPASPEPVGNWTRAQRAALGLPSRAALAAEQERVWHSALQVPRADVLWRSAEGDQVLQPSPLLQRWNLANAAAQRGLAAHATSQSTAQPTAETTDEPTAQSTPPAPPPADPRLLRRVEANPSLPPQPTVALAAAQPSAQPLRITSLSASSYSDLRTCPYRFFALRLLGLHPAPELDQELSKRDFGSWLHSVLADFHTQRKALAQDTQHKVMAQDTQRQTAGVNATPSDTALLDQSAAKHRIPGSGFVPFAAAWPQVRDSYLAWLAQHEAEGWQFDQAELDRSLAHTVSDNAAHPAHQGTGDGTGQTSIQLKGRLDRVDRLSRGPEAGTAYVMDYKTESTAASQAKTKTPAEDTQLAFYAALLGEDDLHAAYVNLAERACKTTAQDNVMAARDAVLQGITVDVQRIHAGHAMPALGEGKACDYCDARGLCRKDMWTL